MSVVNLKHTMLVGILLFVRQSTDELVPWPQGIMHNSLDLLTNRCAEKQRLPSRLRWQEAKYRVKSGFEPLVKEAVSFVIHDRFESAEFRRKSSTRRAEMIK